MIDLEVAIELGAADRALAVIEGQQSRAIGWGSEPLHASYLPLGAVMVSAWCSLQ